MVPSAATASVPQLLHFPLNVDIWREGAGFNKSVWFFGRVVLRWNVCFD